MSDSYVTCPDCKQRITALCSHLPGCSLLKRIATQDTEPLTTDAARIVELERRVRELERHVVKTKPVLLAALELVRDCSEDADPTFRAGKLLALMKAVKAFDALQPKG